MNITLAVTHDRRRASVRIATTLVAAVAAAAGGLGLLASPAGAATAGATATIASPGTSTELDSGGSDTQFTVSLPAQAACSGDTATGGYHVYSYLLKKGTPLSGVTFINSPSAGFGLFDPLGAYYGPVNTAIGTGQIILVPNDFEFGSLVAQDGTPVSSLLYTGTGTTATGVWEAGLTCTNTNGVPVDNWNTEVTFAASASDANGFTWTAVPGSTTTTTTTTTTTAPTSTTTTTDPDSTTTTTTDPNSSTTSTTAPAALTVGTDSSGGTTPADVAGSSTTPSSTGGTLAYTGIRTAKGLGIGLLAVGLGLMLLGWGYRKKFRPARRAE